MKDAKTIIDEDLAISVGIGATLRVGSDAYPYYISEVLPNGVIGIYSPKSHFDNAHPWQGGTEVVDPFDPNAESEIYIKRCYGNWWKVSRDDKARIERFISRWENFTIGHAYAYQDPSF